MDMRSIGFFDSGVGGVTVLNAVKKLLPNENYIYLGDNQNTPYGNKSIDEICSLSYLAVNKLCRYNVKAVVLACSTVSTNCYDILSKLVNVKLIPTFPPLLNLSGRTAVFCTEATSNSTYFNRFKSVDVYPLKYLAKDVEENISDLGRINLSSHLPRLNHLYDNVVLGCTHYSFIKDKFRSFFPSSQIFDGSTFTAKTLCDYLSNANLLSSDEGGNVVFLHDFHRKNASAYNIIQKLEQTF